METDSKNSNKLFRATRSLFGEVSVTYDNVELVAKNRYDMGTSIHFEWGNSSHGAEALAYAILNKIGSQDIAHRYAKTYMNKVLLYFKKDNWTLEAAEVFKWINQNTNFSMDKTEFDKGVSTYAYEERRQEDRRKEERRIKREEEFQEKIQKRLKEYEAEMGERRHEDRRQEDRRVITTEKVELSEDARVKYQQEISNYKKLVLSQKTELEACKLELQRYKLFVKSLNIKSMYENYSELEG